MPPTPTEVIETIEKENTKKDEKALKKEKTPNDQITLFQEVQE